MKNYQKFLLITIVFFNFFNKEAQGQPYWQQEVNYTIEVVLDDELHQLRGNITIFYTNHSPHVLDRIYMHLWPNAFRDRTSAFAQQQLKNGDLRFFYSSEEERGYIDSLNFEINGETVEWEFMAPHPDVAILHLNQPLQSGDQVVIFTPFKVQIPVNFSRLGRRGQSYQISQWYPKPAVYDRHGWHPMPYLSQGEFYSEFGTFDVSITLPENYVVGATGNLQNEEELLWLMEKDRETRQLFVEEDAGDDPFEIDIHLNNGDTIEEFPPSSEKTKTLRYIQENVHDFAWFADKRYNVLHDEVRLPGSGRTVSTWSMFLDRDANIWRNSLDYINRGIYYHSLWVGDYPYDQMTAVEGALLAGSGMEYPTITVIGRMPNRRLLERVIVHEIGHNWFYGILGFNERINPWMDEGMTTFYEYRYMQMQYPGRTLLPSMGRLGRFFGIEDLTERELYEYAYKIQARQNLDQPMQLPAFEFTPMNYWVSIYDKSARAIEHMEAYLGTGTFDRSMQAFYEEWKFKHPWPEDFRRTMERESNKDLSWFFDELLPTTKTMDYTITNARKLDQQYQITLKNKGEISAPFPIAAFRNDTIVGLRWIEGFQRDTTVFVRVEGDVDYFRIDPTHVTLEANRNNNTYYTGRTLANRLDPIRLQFLGSLDNPYRSQIYFMPTIGWNNYDNFMAGLLVHNSLVPRKNLEVTFMPMYSFGSNSITGMGSIRHHFYPDRIFQHMDVGIHAETFHFNRLGFIDEGLRYMKIEPSLQLKFQPGHLRSPHRHFLNLRSVLIQEESIKVYNVPFQPSPAEIIKQSYQVNELEYIFTNNRTLHPLDLNLTLRHHEHFMKAMGTYNQRLNFEQLPRPVEIRVFAGGFLHESFPGLEGRNFNLNLSGVPGRYDYMYDHVYLGRSEFQGFFYQQMMIREGGMKVRTDKFPFGTSDEWLATVNVKVPLPVRLPVSIFAGAGTYAGAGDGLTEPVLWEAGASLNLINNIVEIHFPILMSNDLKMAFEEDQDSNYLQRITFMVNFRELNPLKVARNIRL